MVSHQIRIIRSLGNKQKNKRAKLVSEFFDGLENISDYTFGKNWYKDQFFKFSHFVRMFPQNIG